MKSRLTLLFLALSLSVLVFVGFRFEPAFADEGCTGGTGITQRATLILTSYPGSYVTCKMQNPQGVAECSTSGWHKSASHQDLNTMGMVVDYVYSIQGGGEAGLPVCRSEISALTGWVHD